MRLRMNLDCAPQNLVLLCLVLNLGVLSIIFVIAAAKLPGNRDDDND